MLHEHDFQRTSLVGFSNEPKRGRIGLVALPIVGEKPALAILETFLHLLAGNRMFAGQLCLDRAADDQPHAIVSK